MRTLALLVVCIALACASSRVTLEGGRDTSGWTKIRDAGGDETLDLLFAMKSENLEELESSFWAVSDPKNPRYGQFLSLEEMSTFGPSARSVDTVTAFLASVGAVPSFTPASDYASVRVTVRQAAELFAARFHLYTNGEQSVVRTNAYTVPADVADAIDFVAGLIGVPPPVPEPKADWGPTTTTTTTTTPASEGVGPIDITSFYGIDVTGSMNKTGNKQAVVEFQYQYMRPRDLVAMLDHYYPNLDPSCKTATIVGDNDPTTASGEGSLDIQYIMGVAPCVPTEYWSIPAFPFWEDLLHWSAMVSNTSFPPFVFSVSYGSQGSYPSTGYMDRLNNDFMKMAMRGITVLFASGDDGCGCDYDCDTMAPSFPADSPFVCSVGGTEFVKGKEVASIPYKSGGGLSSIFPRDEYQESAVQYYLDNGRRMPDSSFYNNLGRGTPDISAVSVGFNVWMYGYVERLMGTSASTPVWGAVVSLLNELRFRSHGSPMGFINPFLYALSAETNNGAFNDITTGHNSVSCCPGWYADDGWDAVTGLGTINFNALANAV